jgi:uncharacterized protein DUF433
MPKLDYRNIEKVSGRCGGQPVVAGTRIRVATILVWYRIYVRVEVKGGVVFEAVPGMRGVAAGGWKAS